jgi:hypothetical protein
MHMNLAPHCKGGASDFQTSATEYFIFSIHHLGCYGLFSVYISRIISRDLNVINRKSVVYSSEIIKKILTFGEYLTKHTQMNVQI